MSFTAKGWNRSVLLSSTPASRATQRVSLMQTLGIPGAQRTLLRTRAWANMRIWASSGAPLPVDEWFRDVEAAVLFFTAPNTPTPPAASCDPFRGSGGFEPIAQAFLKPTLINLSADQANQSVYYELPGDTMDSQSQRVLAGDTGMWASFSVKDPNGYLGTVQGGVTYTWTYSLLVSALVGQH